MTPDYKDREYLRKAYHDRRLSLREIAQEADCGEATVRRWMERYGIERRSVSEARGPLSLKTNSDGYEYFQGRAGGQLRSVYHHRLLAVVLYGYEQVIDRHVHHENGIKWDNRHKNITALDESEHKKYHAEQAERTEHGTFKEVP